MSNIVIKSYIDLLSTYDYSIIEYSHISKGDPFKDKSIYAIDTLKFEFFDDYNEYLIIDNFLCNDPKLVPQLHNIIRQIEKSTYVLINDIITKLNPSEMYSSNIADSTNYRKNLIERMQEFEVIRDGKLDDISLDSLLEYYKR